MYMNFSKGDIIRAIVSTDRDDPSAIRKGNLYEVYAETRHKNSGVIHIKDEPSGNLLVPYSESLFELVVPNNPETS